MDEIRVFYTPKPSHGYMTSMPCPETRDELYAIAKQFDAVWDERLYKWEGQHRDYAAAMCTDAGADIILVVDADEVWLPEQLKRVVGHVEEYAGVDTVAKYRIWRVNMVHFWRSLGWVCRDGMWPERVIVPGGRGGGYISQHMAQPLHMGYAQSPGIVKYKISIHGHKGEFRPEWFEKKFLAWAPGVRDVHPTCVNTWDPEPYDKDLIEDVVGDHPYFPLEIVE